MFSFIGKYSIDSLKLFIPIEFCKILDNRLTDNYVSVHEKTLLDLLDYKTDEIDIDSTFFKAKAIPFDENGIKTKFLIMKMFSDSEGNQTEHLVILINSKTLKQNYFEGISKKTIKAVYTYVMSLNVFEISYKDFINESKCSDVDFKTDTIDKNYIETLAGIKERIEKTKVYSKSYKGHKVFNKKYNKGIAFGIREQSTESYPFFKIYVKCLELEKNRRKLEATKKNITEKQIQLAIEQDAFFHAYLKEIAKDNRFYYILRAEFTLKNKKSIYKFLCDDNRLKTLLECKQSDVKKAIQKVWQIHITKINLVSTSNVLSPTDKIIFNQLQYINILQPNLPFVTILDIVLQNLKGTEKSRAKKKFTNIYFMHFSEEEKLRKIEEQKTTKQILHLFGYIS